MTKSSAGRATEQNRFGSTATDRMVAEILRAAPNDMGGALDVTGEGALPSVYAVTDLAAASIGATGLALAGLLRSIDGRRRAVAVDRRLASFWFAASLRPDGWAPPPPWDPIAGDYRAADGWIRLHTNAPRHRSAALAVLGVEAGKAAVAAAVAGRTAGALEAEVVAAGGCAAVMHSQAVWLASEPGRSVAAEPLIDWRDTGAAPQLFAPIDAARPLAGLRVLDLTRVLAGPVATRLLALLGADVLRIDPPDWDEPGVVPEVMPGKRTARLDLTVEEDRSRFVQLLAKADVLVHGYRPGALDGLGFGEAIRQDVRPGLIEVMLDAYGWSGPWKGRRGFDSLVQMSCGIAEAGMRHLGRDRPTPLPVQALDHATGYLMAFAVLAALRHRREAGRSMRARLSLARTALLLTGHAAGGEAALAPEGPADVANEVEATGWGPARRLVFPLSVEGVTLAAARPAMPLGTHAAAW